MMIASNSRARTGAKKTEEVKGEYGRIWGEEEGNADYGVVKQPSQQHVAPCVKGSECGLGTRDLRMVILVKIRKNAQRESHSQSCSVKPNLDLNYIFLINLAPIEQDFISWKINRKTVNEINIWFDRTIDSKIYLSVKWPEK